ncbi:hypothetical protein Bbelb_109840 [Branchiostoma belcheri]|nr:hypothetical protein Bbelb_109840 [Branchiostoma belcheri]
MWRSKQISIPLKMKLFQSIVVPTAIYACESWRSTKETVQMLDTFQRRCLRTILGISWRDHVSNEELMQRAKVPSLNAVETGELFQKDVDDGSWGSEGKGQGDKGDGSSSDGDTDDDGDSCRAAREAKPRPGTTYASQISTVNLPTYPTGDDALAWNDCLQDFFKTDEDTARSIQKSWPSNLLVKHLIRDRGDFLPSLPNLEEIDLSHHAISDEAVPGLAESLGSCQNLKKVNLSYNKLSDRGDFLPPLPNLKEIDLSNNAISDETVPGLAEGLGSCQNLKKVNLSYNKLHNRGDFLPPLPNLEEIGLSWNAISDVAMPGLTEGLGSCQNLKKVNLSHNKLSGRGDFLPPLPNLEKIDLSWNAISDVAVPGLTEGLGSCQNLKKVNLSGNKLSDRGDFLTPLPNLEEIDLGHNNISDVAVPGLAEGLGSCQKLKKVVLHFNKLADVGELMNAFINLPILTQVDIQYNSIRDESLPAIAAWLKVSTAVEKVRLEYNRFSAEGVRDFVRTMKGKAYSDGCFSDILLYDGSLADVGEAVQAGGEGARREEQQWGRLRSWLRLIKVKVGQLTVLISHEGTRS